MRNPTTITGIRALAVAALVAAAAAPAVHAQEPERFAFTGGEVAIYNLAGEARIEAGEGAAVVVELTRGGQDAHRLRVEHGRLDGRQSLRVVYPDARVVYPALGRGSRTTVRVRDDGTFFDESDGRRVEIAGSGSGIEAFADLRVQVPPGARVAVNLGVGKAFVANVDGELKVHTGSGAIEAEGTRGVLRLDTGSGAVRVRNAEGEVEVDTGSGRVEVHEVRGRRLFVDTGSGSVRGAEIAVDDLEVDTGSGGIRLAGVRAPDIRLDTGSGSVQLGLLADVRRLEVDTGSGSVTLTVPPALSAEIEVDTGSGGIDVDLPITLVTKRQSYLRGRLGDGQGTIRVDTGSGGVRVRAAS